MFKKHIQTKVYSPYFSFIINNNDKDNVRKKFMIIFY